MKYLYTLMAFATMLVGSQVAYADEYTELRTYLHQEISVLDEVMANSSSDELNTNDRVGEQAWYFRRFLIRLRPQVALDIPLFANLKLAPEVELIFDRALPEEWNPYKP